MNQPLRRESIEVKIISVLTLEKIHTKNSKPQEKKNATIKVQTMTNSNHDGNPGSEKKKITVED